MATKRARGDGARWDADGTLAQMRDAAHALPRRPPDRGRDARRRAYLPPPPRLAPLAPEPIVIEDSSSSAPSDRDPAFDSDGPIELLDDEAGTGAFGGGEERAKRAAEQSGAASLPALVGSGDSSPPPSLAGSGAFTPPTPLFRAVSASASPPPPPDALAELERDVDGWEDVGDEAPAAEEAPGRPAAAPRFAPLYPAPPDLGAPSPSPPGPSMDLHITVDPEAMALEDGAAVGPSRPPSAAGSRRRPPSARERRHSLLTKRAHALCLAGRVLVGDAAADADAVRATALSLLPGAVVDEIARGEAEGGGSSRSSAAESPTETGNARADGPDAAQMPSLPTVPTLGRAVAGWRDAFRPAPPAWALPSYATPEGNEVQLPAPPPLPLAVLFALLEQRGDAEESTIGFVAALRSLGVPARVVGAIRAVGSLPEPGQRADWDDSWSLEGLDEARAVGQTRAGKRPSGAEARASDEARRSPSDPSPSPASPPPTSSPPAPSPPAPPPRALPPPAPRRNRGDEELAHAIAMSQAATARVAGSAMGASPLEELARTDPELAHYRAEGDRIKREWKKGRWQLPSPLPDAPGGAIAASGLVQDARRTGDGRGGTKAAGAGGRPRRLRAVARAGGKRGRGRTGAEDVRGGPDGASGGVDERASDSPGAPAAPFSPSLSPSPPPPAWLGSAVFSSGSGARPGPGSRSPSPSPAVETLVRPALRRLPSRLAHRRVHDGAGAVWAEVLCRADGKGAGGDGVAETASQTPPPPPHPSPAGRAVRWVPVDVAVGVVGRADLLPRLSRSKVAPCRVLAAYGGGMRDVSDRYGAFGGRRAADLEAADDAWWAKALRRLERRERKNVRRAIGEERRGKDGAEAEEGSRGGAAGQADRREPPDGGRGVTGAAEAEAVGRGAIPKAEVERRAGTGRVRPGVGGAGTEVRTERAEKGAAGGSAGGVASNAASGRLSDVPGVAGTGRKEEAEEDALDSAREAEEAPKGVAEGAGPGSGSRGQRSARPRTGSPRSDPERSSPAPSPALAPLPASAEPHLCPPPASADAPLVPPPPPASASNLPAPSPPPASAAAPAVLPPTTSSVSFSEDLELLASRQARARVPPATITGFLSHPLYVLSRHLGRRAAPRPGTAPAGLHRGEAYYLRTDVSELKSEIGWRREGLKVRAAELDRPVRSFAARGARALAELAGVEVTEMREEEGDAKGGGDAGAHGGSSNARASFGAAAASAASGPSASGLCASAASASPASGSPTSTSASPASGSPTSTSASPASGPSVSTTASPAPGQTRPGPRGHRPSVARRPSYSLSDLPPGLALALPAKAVGRLYGDWQTEQDVPQVAVGGRVPRNERGNVEVPPLVPHLPRGTTHLDVPGALEACRALGVDYAPALVGFEHRGPKSTPVFRGVVVCDEVAADVVGRAVLEAERRARAERDARARAARAAWDALLRVLLFKVRLEAGDERSGPGDEPSKAARATVLEATEEARGCRGGGAPRDATRRREGRESPRAATRRREGCEPPRPDPDGPDGAASASVVAAAVADGARQSLRRATSFPTPPHPAAAPPGPPRRITRARSKATVSAATPTVDPDDTAAPSAPPRRSTRARPLPPAQVPARPSLRSDASLSSLSSLPSLSSEDDASRAEEGEDEDDEDEEMEDEEASLSPSPSAVDGDDSEEI